MKGTLASHREVAARWSYAELTGRFAAEYAQRHVGLISAALISKIVSGVPFENLTDEEKQLLAAWFDTGYRKDYANAFNGWYTKFRCESWTKSQLARIHTLPIIDPLAQGRQLAFISYLAHPRRKRPDGTPDPLDAAVAADNVPITTPFVQKAPLIVGHWDNGKLTLWEGNFRAVLFARTPDPATEVLVWVPHDGQWPGK